MTDNNCECGNEIENPERNKMCKQCAEEEAMRALASVEPPEGGWPRGSDMDRL